MSCLVSCLCVLQHACRSERAAAVLPGLGKSSWQLQWVTPDAQGRVEEAGGACNTHPTQQLLLMCIAVCSCSLHACW
jgi:hypothetical protein